MNINKVFVAGNLTREVELRSTPSGKSVASFSIATNRIWMDANKQKQQEVEFHNIVVWGRMAELCSQYLTKGRSVFIEGRIKTRKWQDASGVKKSRTEIIAENIQFGPKTGGSAAAGGSDYGAIDRPQAETIPEVNLDDEPVNEGELSVSHQEDDDEVGSIPF